MASFRDPKAVLKTGSEASKQARHHARRRAVAARLASPWLRAPLLAVPAARRPSARPRRPRQDVLLKAAAERKAREDARARTRATALIQVR